MKGKCEKRAASVMAYVQGEGEDKFPDECPDWACEWCFENGKLVEADGESGDCLCAECELDRTISYADALHDQMKEGL